MKVERHQECKWNTRTFFAPPTCPEFLFSVCFSSVLCFTLKLDKTKLLHGLSSISSQVIRTLHTHTHTQTTLCHKIYIMNHTHWQVVSFINSKKLFTHNISSHLTVYGCGGNGNTSKAVRLAILTVFFL